MYPVTLAGLMKRTGLVSGLGICKEALNGDEGASGLSVDDELALHARVNANRCQMLDKMRDNRHLPIFPEKERDRASDV
jgi:hypothetical protein